MVEEDLVQRFMDAFTGEVSVHGTYKTIDRTQGKKVQMEGPTYVRKPVTEGLWKRHLDGDTPLGIIPLDAQDNVRWAAIDVDNYDDLNHGELAQELRTRNIPLVPVRSKSGGAHLYLFCTKPFPAKLVKAKIKEWAAMLGFGRSEIFPKQTTLRRDDGDLGNWLNMPYFNANATERYMVDETGAAVMLEDFLDYVDMVKIVDPKELSKNQGPVKGDAENAKKEPFWDGPPCLQIMAKHGIPPGGRNNFLYMSGLYWLRKRPDAWEDQVLKDNAAYCDPALPTEEVMNTVIKSLRRKQSDYKCNDKPMEDFCDRRGCMNVKYGIESSKAIPLRGSLSKLETVPPRWFLQVEDDSSSLTEEEDENARMDLTTDEFMKQHLFQKRMIEDRNLYPPKVTDAVWRRQVQRLLDEVTIIPVPDEISPQGQFKDQVETFCMGRQKAFEKEELLDGKPWTNTEDGRVYFRFQDLERYLIRQKFPEANKRPYIHGLIKGMGGDNCHLSVKSRSLRVWWLPAFDDPNGYDAKEAEGGAF